MANFVASTLPRDAFDLMMIMVASRFHNTLLQFFDSVSRRCSKRIIIKTTLFFANHLLPCEPQSSTHRSGLFEDGYLRFDGVNNIFLLSALPMPNAFPGVSTCYYKYEINYLIMIYFFVI